MSDADDAFLGGILLGVLVGLAAGLFLLMPDGADDADGVWDCEIRRAPVKVYNSTGPDRVVEGSKCKDVEDPNAD